MSKNFNWRTDEDFDWDEEEIKAPTRRKPVAWQRPALFLGALLILAGAAYLVARRVGEQVDAAASDIAVDVLSSYDLLLRAAGSGDRELFVTVLSGRDPGWTEAQKMLLDAGQVFGRDTFALRLDKEGLLENRPVADNVTLSSDFTAAEVTLRVPYDAQVGNGLTVPVILEQTQIYRRGNDQRWLLSPPLDDFWGPWETLAGQRLRVRYPTRDEALATRLAADLDSRLGAMCGLPGVLCPADLRVELRLGEQPGTLLTGLDKETQLAGGPSFNLAAPSLVGTPVDEAGYQALLRGYANHVVSALLTRYSGYECCDHPLFYQALLDYQLSQLAVQPWPLSAVDYNTLLNTAQPASRMFDAWSEPFDPLRQGAAWRQVYALTEFILSGKTTTPVPEIQRMLNRQATYSGWLYELIDIPYYDEYGVNAAWMQFLFDKSDLAAEGPPRAYPQEAVTLVCRPQDGSSTADFVRYDLAAMAASETTPLSGRDFFPLPDGRIAATRQLLSGGVALFVLDGDKEPIRVELPVDPARHTTVVSSYNANGSLVLLHDDLTSPDVVRFSLLDPARCSAESCQAAALPGRISMSPDGLHALAFVPDQEIGVSRTQLLDADLAPIRELGNAWDGGWFDNESYYVVTVDAVLAGRIGESDAQTLLDTAQLRERAPRGAVPLDEKTVFSSAVVNPDNPRQMLVAYTGINREAQVYQSQLLILDLATGEISVDPFPLSGSEEEPLVESYFIQVETHGPWIELLSYSPLTSSYMGTIQILDWQGNVANTLTTQGFNNYAGLQWSPDYEWLIVMDRRWTRIMAVGTEFQRLIFSGNDDGCFGAYWAPLETGGADS